MKIIKLLEKNFWLPICLSLLIGLFFPNPGKNLSFLVVPILMFNFFLSCLKINFFDIVSHVKKPIFIIYILILYLLIIPTFFYVIFTKINHDIAIGVLLLVSMPPGVSAVILTDIFEGNTSLSMVISIAAYLLSPFTIFILFLLLVQKQLHLDVSGLLKTLLLINFVPMIASQLLRKTSKGLIDQSKNYFSVVNICGISIMTYIAVAAQAGNILENPFKSLIDVLWMYLIFAGLYIIGYYCGFWRKRKDKVALAVTKSYMNNAIAIGLAITFFNPQIALFIALSLVPWSTTLGIFKYATKYLD